jgi:hypothetical protein
MGVVLETMFCRAIQEAEESPCFCSALVPSPVVAALLMKKHASLCSYCGPTGGHSSALCHTYIAVKPPAVVSWRPSTGDHHGVVQPGYLMYNTHNPIPCMHSIIT